MSAQNYLHRYVCKLNESLAEEEKARRPGGDRGAAGGKAGGPGQKHQPAVRTLFFTFSTHNTTSPLTNKHVFQGAAVVFRLWAALEG